ncbi:hypothetical protein Q8W71_05485 [Methylobacterium sp. NEAU 140]|uniref:hypothetical protein n=1 Tax=Methylobacterium sp. NEAU 140 TaxID=3064945 RepID=UPI002735D990|nr:hypothetical protein [Methylobacterium sp. NEAU 140]MDP4022065.1 hypothetical protein [Methylobacterium sp. NEAU 140]
MQNKLIPAKKVREELGGISDMTLYRWLADENLKFPRPTYIKKRRYFDSGDLAAFKERLALDSLERTATQ